jgi:DNA-binding NarL/FixJ family response regulator
VVIADDAEALRSLVRALLEECAEITVVAEASDGAEALVAVAEHAPDVLLLDLSMPRVDGLQVLLDMQSRGVATRTVVFSAFAQERMAELMLANGAVSYVEKGAPPDVLCAAVLEAFRTQPPTDFERVA